MLIHIFFNHFYITAAYEKVKKKIILTLDDDVNIFYPFNYQTNQNFSRNWMFDAVKF